MSMVPVLLIGGEDIRDLLPMSRCIPLMERAMRETSAGRVAQPPRLAMRLQNSINLFGAMIGHACAPPVLGAKLMSVFPNNHGTGRPSHQGFVLLFDPETGSPIAILDGFEITAQRTAAVSAVATKVLSTEVSSVLAILGTSEQALRHLAAIRIVRKLHEVRIWGRSADKAQALAACASRTHDIVMRAARTVSEAVAGASIVCCVTASRDPILHEWMLEPGMHINAVGASTAAAAEVDAAVVPRVRFYVDQRDMAKLHAAEYRRALSEGLITLLKPTSPVSWARCCSEPNRLVERPMKSPCTNHSASRRRTCSPRPKCWSKRGARNVVRPSFPKGHASKCLGKRRLGMV